MEEESIIFNGLDILLLEKNFYTSKCTRKKRYPKEIEKCDKDIAKIIDRISI